MRLNNLKWAMGFACALLIANVACAEVVYTYTAESPNYFADVSSKIGVNLYLQETLTGTSTSLIQANGGLLCAGISVTREDAVPDDPASLTCFSYNTADLGVFDSPDLPLSSTGVQFSENAFLPGGVQLGNTGGGAAKGYCNRIYLGTVYILVGATANETTTFDVYVDTASGDGFIGGLTLTTNLIDDLDITDGGLGDVYTGAADAGPTEFTITTTPEPTSLASVNFVLGGLLLRRQRRKYKQLRVL